MIRALPCPADVTGAATGDAIGRLAADCLKLEVATYPKPGLVSHVDMGAHDDMDAALLDRSADTLAPWFAALWDAGAAGNAMDRLRAIGLAAERAMMAATGDVNTHRGAIFGMGLLCAAAGFRHAYAAPGTLGEIVAARWAPQILDGPMPLHTHGAAVARQHGAGGARIEAAAGFRSIYAVALPALAEGCRMAPDDAEAARIQCCMALIGAVDDTNLLHRGGAEGLAFAQWAARRFLAEGGVSTADWRERAQIVHRGFVARRLSPGGCADLLAMALFVERAGA